MVQDAAEMGIESVSYTHLLYDAAMLSITSYTKVGLRLATFIGMTVGCISLVVAIIYLILKLLFWDNFPAGKMCIRDRISSMVSFH